MKKMTGSEIRQSFINFFVSKGHTIVPSASLVPGADQTLLFTNAGMVQFKDIFLGTDRRSYTRAVNSQKCMRVAGKHNDLDDVGRDDTHHTFFEMLGNWSFGDYYKKEAIEWAWELLTKVWDLDKSRLWFTCFKDELAQIPTDFEAANFWKAQPGLDPEHVLFFGRKDNLWEMAETGPCGPCSEIHYDLGPDRCTQKGDPKHICGVNGTCGRYLEIWNLVFIQYNRLNENEFELLPKQHVDTGMGFERIVSILQDVTSNYRTDLFSPILDAIQELTGHDEIELEKMLTPYRVISDHVRAASFLIADGVIPGNVARNYICRMIIRRAALFGQKIGLNEAFLYRLAGVVVDNFGKAYPELIRSREIIVKELLREENRFQRTVDNGLTQLAELLDELTNKDEKRLSGKATFELYATHGLPLEITRDVAREKGYEVDEEGFHKAMEEHRIISSAGNVFDTAGGERVEFFTQLFKELVEQGKVDNIGVIVDPYGGLERQGELLAIIKQDQVVETAAVGDQVEVIIPFSPFYIESGGQVADTGKLVSTENGWEIEIKNCYKPSTGIVVLTGTVKSGSPQIGDRLTALVDRRRRMAIRRNHTATHLLHAALKVVLGDHARQAGSLVAPDYLRFDFTHPEAISASQIQQIENIVNTEIYSDYGVDVSVKNLEKAMQEGAIALFGEKYSQEVRTISIGDEEVISYELCGGTHVDHTGQIGIFLITSEGSIASGIRRIEAVTGEMAFRSIQAQLSSLKHTTRMLNITYENLPEKVGYLLQEIEQLKKQCQQVKYKIASLEFSGVMKNTHTVRGIPVLSAVIPEVDVETLRSLSDRFRQQYPTGVVVLGSVVNEKPGLIAAVTDDLIDKGLDAVQLIRHLSKEIGGGGGGKPNLAQAGGKFPEKLDKAISMVDQFVEEQL